MRIIAIFLMIQGEFDLFVYLLGFLEYSENESNLLHNSCDIQGTQDSVGANP